MARLKKRIWKLAKISCWAFLAVFTLMSIAWFGFPRQLGRTWAKFDLFRNHYEVRVYGYPLGDRNKAELLENYGVSYARVAGCVVDNSIIESTNAYNTVMRKAILEDLGVDINKILFP